MPGHRTYLAYVMILPSLFLTMWIIGYPIIDVVWMAVHDVNRFGNVRELVGFGNFQSLAADPIFWSSLWRTLVWTFGVTLGAIVLSVPVALVLNLDFPGRAIARVIILLPWATSVAMTAIVWRWALNGQYGMLNAMLWRLHMIDQPVEWLSTATTAFPLEMAIGIIVSIPFTVTVYLGGLSSLPHEIYEAAHIDGAGAFRRFLHLTLPMTRPFINIAFVLNLIYTFNTFSVIWILTQGDPANGTDILVTYLYKLAFRYGKLAEASAMSLVMLAVVLAITMIYGRIAMREAKESGE